jgi:hypothetical protein
MADWVRESGLTCAGGGDAALCEREVAFFFEALLSVFLGVLERFLAVIEYVPFLQVTSLASGSLLSWVSNYLGPERLPEEGADSASLRPALRI